MIVLSSVSRDKELGTVKNVDGVRGGVVGYGEYDKHTLYCGQNQGSYIVIVRSVFLCNGCPPVLVILPIILQPCVPLIAP